jgi:hypothetical protein
MRLDGEHGFGGGMFHEDSTFPLLMRVNGGDGLGDDVEELTCSILPTCGSTKHSLWRFSNFLESSYTESGHASFGSNPGFKTGVDLCIAEFHACNRFGAEWGCIAEFNTCKRNGAVWVCIADFNTCKRMVAEWVCHAE